MIMAINQNVWLISINDDCTRFQVRQHVHLMYQFVCFNFSAFCIVDNEKTCMAVTVYNLAKGRGVTVGDSVAIPEPYLTHQTFTYAGSVSKTPLTHSKTADV